MIKRWWKDIGWIRPDINSREVKGCGYSLYCREVITPGTQTVTRLSLAEPLFRVREKPRLFRRTFFIITCAFRAFGVFGVSSFISRYLCKSYLLVPSRTQAKNFQHTISIQQPGKRSECGSPGCHCSIQGNTLFLRHNSTPTGKLIKWHIRADSCIWIEIIRERFVSGDLFVCVYN